MHIDLKHFLLPTYTVMYIVQEKYTAIQTPQTRVVLVCTSSL